MQFTFSNHLKYYIGNRVFGHRENGFEKYKVELGSIDESEFKKGNFLQELHRTADLIYQDLKSDLSVFLSGGTDSEIVIRNFLSIGVKPTCFIIRFKDGFNSSDVEEAEMLAKELGLKLNFIDFDVKEFLYSGEAIEFGKSIQCAQITYLMIYFCILKVSSPAVMGGEVLLKRNIYQNPSTWYYCFRESEDASVMRFSLKYNIPLVNEYFSYTPELLLHYLEDSSIKELVDAKFNYKLTSTSSKNEILKRLVPSIRIKKKTHGFERLLAFNMEAMHYLRNTQILRLESSLEGIEYNQAIKILRGNNEGN